MTSDPKAAPLIAVRAQTLRITLLALAALIAITAIQIGAPQWLGQEPGAIDYKIFHYVGQLSREGQAILPYDAPAFEAWQAARPGGEIFMPWTYPPQMGLFTEALSLLPVGLGYMLFTGLGLAALAWALFRLAPKTAAAALMLTLPATLMNIRAGQNGFLTALLFALTFLFLLRQRRLDAGLSLGLLAIKPHLGLGVGLVALVRGGAAMVAAAIAVLALTLGLATWAFGAEIWPAFLQSVRDSSTFLTAGAYPMERMISVYALLSSLGVPAEISFAAQSVMTLSALGLIALALLRRWRLDALLALSGSVGLAVSPYGYDYDLVVLAPALALALPAIARQTRGALRPILIAALLLATGWGLLTVLLAGRFGLGGLPALGALGFLVALALITRALFADQAQRPA